MTVNDLDTLRQLLAETERDLARLTARRVELLDQITEQQREQATTVIQVRETSPQLTTTVTHQSAQEIKITLFRRLFRGREDVYPRRFESLKTGKTGYQPACRNE